ncbi:MAG: 2-oxo acid dehydrogenase subunit E2, partial [Blautia sp.]|nr:2-oxo acid dehydrogenase subunit E2 [Blautia sp.]
MGTKRAKRKWGDRKDGRWVKDVPGLQAIMPHIMINRTDAEVYLHDTIDITQLQSYLEKKNAEHPEYKTTLFHCIVTGLSRMVTERPMMNRFIQGRRTYERDEITIGFVCKRRFTDHAEEALMFLKAKPEDTIDSISKRIIGDVHETRKSESST